MIDHQMMLPAILDACCGPRMMWFDSKDRRALFIDKRQETHPIDIGTSGTIGRSPVVVAPDVVADFTSMPFPSESFYMVVFDPPHIPLDGPIGILERKYGSLPNDWRAMLAAGFRECFRVLKPNGTLIFKWAESNFLIADILALTPHSPLFGHRYSKATHWYVFMKEAKDYAIECARQELTIQTLQDDLAAMRVDRDSCQREAIRMHEKAAFLESREVCAAAHDNVDTCGYCQRDNLAEALRKIAKFYGTGGDGNACAEIARESLTVCGLSDRGDKNG